LLDEAIDIIDTYFWSEDEGAMRESFNRDWREEEAYRGANSNMHATEAFLPWPMSPATTAGCAAPSASSSGSSMVMRLPTVTVVEHFDRDWQCRCATTTTTTRPTASALWHYAGPRFRVGAAAAAP
jgi:mannose/cellobiose epimerase-like protein (N-acyl-D-glucosamine 2-epimerase family)